jgi:hypothetical protein
MLEAILVVAGSVLLAGIVVFVVDVCTGSPLTTIIRKSLSGSGTGKARSGSTRNGFTKSSSFSIQISQSPPLHLEVFLIGHNEGARIHERILRDELRQLSKRLQVVTEFKGRQ